MVLVICILGVSFVLTGVVGGFYTTRIGGLGLMLFGASLVTAFIGAGLQSTWFGVGVWLVFISGLIILFLFFCSVRRERVDIPFTIWVIGLLCCREVIAIVCNRGRGVCEPLTFYRSSASILV